MALWCGWDSVKETGGDKLFDGYKVVATFNDETANIKNLAIPLRLLASLKGLPLRQ